MSTDSQDQKDLSHSFEPFMKKDEQIAVNQFKSMMKLSMLIAMSAALVSCFNAYLLIFHGHDWLLNTPYTVESVAQYLLCLCIALCFIAAIPLIKAITTITSINISDEEVDGETFN